MNRLARCALMVLAVPVGVLPFAARGESGQGASGSGDRDPVEYTVRGQRYQLLDSAEEFSERGIASWYGSAFHGRKTASGEPFDMHALTAAHTRLPLQTRVRVSDVRTGASVIVRINDRGPFADDRIIDLSRAAAERLGMIDDGTAEVAIEALDDDDDGGAAMPR